MGKPIELMFHINAYSKARFPLRRLGQYIAELGQILGEFDSVHLDRIEDGSVSPVARVDAEAAPKVLARAHAVRSGEGPETARSAKAKIERFLREDNAEDAELLQVGGARILQFRGRDALVDAIGPVRQHGELTGIVIMVGGKNDPVPVHLEDGDRIYVCEAKRDVARRLARCLFDTPIRVTGYGRWNRTDTEMWEIADFRIADFQELDGSSISDVIANLRTVRSIWLDGNDPLATLRKVQAE